MKAPVRIVALAADADALAGVAVHLRRLGTVHGDAAATLPEAIAAARRTGACIVTSAPALADVYQALYQLAYDDGRRTSAAAASVVRLRPPDDDEAALRARARELAASGATRRAVAAACGRSLRWVVKHTAPSRPPGRPRRSTERSCGGNISTGADGEPR